MTRRESKNENRRCSTAVYDFHFTHFSHLKEHVKKAYLETKDLNDDQLLMQYFKKHDSDNNMKLDGLELLEAIIRMQGNE